MKRGVKRDLDVVKNYVLRWSNKNPFNAYEVYSAYTSFRLKSTKNHPLRLPQLAGTDHCDHVWGCRPMGALQLAQLAWVQGPTHVAKDMEAATSIPKWMLSFDIHPIWSMILRYLNMSNTYSCVRKHPKSWPKYLHVNPHNGTNWTWEVTWFQFVSVLLENLRLFGMTF